MLDELYKKYVVGMHCEVFSPWKILRAIDLSIGGCLNYNGVKPFDLWKDWDDMKGVLYLPEQPFNAVPTNYIL